ncbi:hypothetical protein FSPOR_9095 [Fusarium sporotrichioides]|uniref:Xylanolytic transcriptional activator regulatory domain-containing protein n=1 Tax=Fusarium sporotrichioides TaxID=5514 RepID=A0A395RRE1_FUSSP|nr:hypothetical protein FSPOR_9095 [Fusarium sporotrichioides]
MISVFFWYHTVDAGMIVPHHGVVSGEASHIRNLEDKVAEYENATSLAPDFNQGLVRVDSEPLASEHSPPPPAESRSTSLSGRLAEGGAAHNGYDKQQQPQQQLFSIPRSPHSDISPVPAVASGPKIHPIPRVLAPATSLSSSETFSSELRNLLTERSRPNPGLASAPANDTTPRSICQSRLGVDKIKHWPTEEDAYSMLNIVVLNVGISQHLFDVRAFSDNLSSLFGDYTVDAEVPDIWYPECLLIFAIGRLLQAKWDDESKPPGDEFFQEALKRMPNLSDLRKYGVLGIELMGLSALYLQIADRKEDAYLYASMALRLSLGLSLHKSSPSRNHKRSEAVHRNRLWWSIYMQERRLAAAVGFHSTVSDASITAAQPSDQIGYPSAAAIAVNVKLAQITGPIYSQNNDPEGVFMKEVQDILHSLHKIENEMPVEISGGPHPTELLLDDAPLSSSQLSSARTISSLHLTVNQVHILTLSSLLWTNIFTNPAKHAFLDLDCLFSAGFIFVLAVIIDSDKAQAYEGIESVRSILSHLSTLGNRAATKRLDEIDQMCAGLALQTETPGVDVGQPEVLMQPFSFYSGTQHPSANGPMASGEAQGRRPSAQTLTEKNVSEIQDAVMARTEDLGDIVLEGEDDLYWIYHNPSLSLTGVEQVDWETLENHIF